MFGLIVIMARQMYGNEINRQLEDQEVYKKLSSDPTWGIHKQLVGILKQALKGLLNVIYVNFCYLPILGFRSYIPFLRSIRIEKIPRTSNCVG